MFIHFLQSLLISFVSTTDERQEEGDQQPCPSYGSSSTAAKMPQGSIVRQEVTAPDTATQEPQFLGGQINKMPPREPVTYFRDIIDNEILQLIVTESNRYSLQMNINKPLLLTQVELEQFLGIVFYMSIVKLPRARLYWNPQVRIPKVSDAMQLKRFEEIKSKLHFHNNEIRSHDQIAKVRPILNCFRDKARSLPKEQRLSIDEQMVPFKGKSGIKQYLPKKPKKWGYKMFVCCDAKGLTHDIEIYTGKIEHCPGQPDIGASGNIVLRLLESVPRDIWHQIYVDNWFNSLPLQVTLWKQGVACIGTVRPNRLKGCVLPSDTQLAKDGRGSIIIKSGIFGQITNLLHS